jgi:hypothetical protein
MSTDSSKPASTIPQKPASTPPRAKRRSDPTLHVAQMVAALNLADRQLAERMVLLGFDAETASVLYLLPLIQVAWANGSVSRAERAQILRILRLREIAEDSRAWQMCESLLASRPTDAYLLSSRLLLQDLLKSKGPAVESQVERELIDLCVEVAEASGGLFGFGKRISKVEADAIRAIADGLGAEAVKSLDRQLRG